MDYQSSPGKTKVRINPKTQKAEYWCEWKIKKNGRWQGTKTGKYPTAEAAEMARLKADKMQQAELRKQTKANSKAISTILNEYESYLKARQLEKGFSAGTRHSRLTWLKALKGIIDYKGLTALNITNDDVKAWQLQLEEYKVEGKYLTSSYYNNLAGELNRIIDYINKQLPESRELTRRIQRKQKKTADIKPNSIYDKEWRYIEPQYFALMTQSIAFSPDLNNVPAGFPDKLKPQHYAYIVMLTMYYSGMRYEELRCLQWGDLPEDCSYIDINKARNARIEPQDRDVYEQSGDTKNRSSNRKIPTHPVLQPYLQYMRKMIMQLPDEDALPLSVKMLEWLVFPSRTTGKMLSPHFLQHWLDKLTAKEGLPHVHIHGLRHSYAMWSALNDVPMELTGQAMGHSDTEMLKQVYAVKDKEMTYQQLQRYQQSHMTELATSLDYSDEELKRARLLGSTRQYDAYTANQQQASIDNTELQELQHKYDELEKQYNDLLYEHDMLLSHVIDIVKTQDMELLDALVKAQQNRQKNK